MFLFALITGKVLAFLLRLVGHGSDLPGRVALKLCPRFLSRFDRRGRIIAVTGSNGKTSTAGMIAQILTACGKSVRTNPIGSNMTGGVATVMLRAANLHGRINCDYLVLETDERYSRLIFADFKPDILLVTNLFRDQITRNNNVDFIYNILNRVITPEITLVLNALDPISGRLGRPENKRVRFGADANAYTTPECPVLTHDCKVCPVCKHRMGYEWFLYNHIGKFACPACGYHAPEADFTLGDPDLETGAFRINDAALVCADPTLYGMLNITAAVAVCVTAGLDFEAAVAAAGSLKTNKTRYERLDLGGREGVMILSKNQNPVSFDLSIGEVLRMKGDKTVVAYINNINHTHEKDTTWLWDIAFERLAGQVNNVVCAGPRAYDLAVRLRYAGFDMDTVRVAPRLADVPAAVDSTVGRVCVLTELYDARQIVAAVGKKTGGDAK